MSPHYLRPGPQTPLTDRVREHAARAADGASSLRERIERTCAYIHALEPVTGYHASIANAEQARENKELWHRLFRKRDIDAILACGPLPTCSDFGILLRGLMAAQGVPTAYIEAFHADYILDRPWRAARVMSHALARVFYDGTSLLIDPRAQAHFYDDEHHLMRERSHVIAAEGLDSWDLGVRSLRDLDRLMHAKREELIEALGEE